MHSPHYVYSPAQNIALWVQQWVCGRLPLDETIDALNELGGPHRLGDGGEIAYVLREFRAHCTPSSRYPWLSLVLPGPGQALLAQLDAPAALLLRHDPASPATLAIAKNHHGATQWNFAQAEVPMHLQSFLMPGDADTQLRRAIDQAAEAIAAQGMALDRVQQPRLRVGTLRDFYETPGLPPEVPERAAKLIARADYASAILETVLSGFGEHRFDPQLLSTANAIRDARMAAVAYCSIELGREYA
ncbi:hypothetical protein [Corynebacterium pelargi]|uniref:Uncharacterized protein n=1 Tax=Corynebacterium pelargi TaxID=1471400 RepID=A0A410W8T9_9CORY|nr:hypothetical protein [Corynebacterium pelargi]QAU52358.1 hypothetical protein CPELA_05430 [Corynebacterium pelargi]GGG68245.1 hypothetical protein GCM10007338_01100 [Corynebacterium pelargi]